MKKLKVGILFGGKSAEHEVSLQSARNVFDAIDRTKYEPVLIGISKEGLWFLNNEADFLFDSEDPKRIRLNPSGDPIAAVPECKGTILNIAKEQECFVDVVFPVLHGPFGEDGTVQGFLKLAGIPFAGAGVLASAVGMDKDIMKRLLRDSGLPIGKYLALKSHEKIPGFEEVVDKLGLPFFVKPANMGSSIGVNKAHNKDEYLAAVNEAFLYDTKIIFEEFIAGRELECSVLGNEEPEASVIGEVISSRGFYSYNAKYIDENGAHLEIPAAIDAETALKAKELAIKTFRVLECEGLGRVDFFLKENGAIVINEINTMPGFTQISMYPKLWEASGLSYSNLIDSIIQLAIKRFEKEKKIRTSVL